MVVMEMLKYTCIMSVTFLHCIVCKFEKWIEKGAQGNFFVDGCHGNTNMHMPAKFHLNAFHGLQVWEVKKSFLVKKCLRPFFCSWSSWKHWTTHAYQVTLPCIAWFASLRSEEVVIAWGNFCQLLSWKRSNTHAYQVLLPCIAWFASLKSEEVVIAWGNFLSMVVMEMLKYTCVPSFTSMHCMVCKFEKWRSSYREKCLREFFVDGCHGNNEIYRRTKFHLHVHYSWQVWEVKEWF